MQTLKWALLNVLRNKRRSVVTVSLVAVAVAAIVTAGGFASFTYQGLKILAASESGNVLLAHKDYFTKFESEPLEFGLSGYEELGRELIADERVRAVLPKLNFSGLISNGDKSEVFLGSGVLGAEFNVKGPFMELKAGRVLGRYSPEDVSQLLIGDLLAEALQVEVGSGLTVLSTTVDGALNAFDGVVRGIVSTGVPEADKRLLFMALQDSQDLLMTEKVSTVGVHLFDIDDTDAVIADSAAAWPQLATNSWEDQAFYYQAVRSLYNRIFGIMGVIVLILVFFALSNTMSMSVVERTREIGVLRAIGTRAGEIVNNFVLEAMWLALAGAVFGCLLGVGISLFFTVAGFEMPPPPGRSDGYPLNVDLVLDIYIFAWLAVMLISVAAAWLASTRAARKPIVEALAHV